MRMKTHCMSHEQAACGRRAYMGDICGVALKSEAMCNCGVQYDAFMRYAHGLRRPDLNLGARPTRGHFPRLVAVGEGLQSLLSHVWFPPSSVFMQSRFRCICSYTCWWISELCCRKAGSALQHVKNWVASSTSVKLQARATL